MLDSGSRVLVSGGLVPRRACYFWGCMVTGKPVLLGRRSECELALTPAEVVAATLNLDRDTIAVMRKDKPLIMP